MLESSVKEKCLAVLEEGIMNYINNHTGSAPENTRRKIVSLFNVDINILSRGDENAIKEQAKNIASTVSKNVLESFWTDKGVRGLVETVISELLPDIINEAKSSLEQPPWQMIFDPVSPTIKEERPEPPADGPSPGTRIPKDTPKKRVRQKKRSRAPAATISEFHKRHKRKRYSWGDGI